jgi:SAM-dependent methyltransferase
MSREPSNQGTKPDYAVHYEKWHKSDSRHINDMLSFYSKLLDAHLPQKKDSRILDVGCGMGFALLLLKRMGYTNIRGLELDESQATQARRNGLDVDLTNDTAEYLKQASQSFDFVLCMDVIEHVLPKDQIEFVSALRECLAPGGTLLATVPNANSSLASRWRYIDWTHHTSFTESSLEFLLKASGFSSPKILEADVKQFYTSGTSRRFAPLTGVLRRTSRLIRRIDLIGELGWDEGLSLPISVNLMAIGRRA